MYADLFSSFGEAVAEKGVRGMAELIPGGALAFDLIKGTYEKFMLRRKLAKLDAIGKEMEAMVQAAPEEIRKVAIEVVEKVIPKELEHLRPIVQIYLEHIPAATRQSLKRPEDRSGRSVPAGFRLESADELAKILPKAWPRINAGIPLPGRPGWVLDRYLGSGGFGEVWRAFQTNSDSVCRAIKFCGSGENARTTLIRESNVLKRIMNESSHRGIVPLLDMNLDGDVPWLAYEYVEGGTLADAIGSWKKRTIEERQKRAISALLQLLDAVGYFHGLQPPVVHRDLKPANILYQLGTRSLRITDFGIGGIAAAEQIKDNTIGSLTRGAQLPTSLHGSHTPLYASPQQKEGQPPDPRDDVHALGVILYQMLTGQLDQAPGPDLELKSLGVVQPLIDLVAHCTLKDAGLRLKDARDIAAQLKDAIDVNRDGLIQRSEIENFVANQREKQTREQRPPDRMPQIPGYQMLRAVARSGDGHFYLARHESTGEQRLIKYGLLDDSDGLEQQMTILERLDHPQLVRYRDHRKGSETRSGDNRYWIVMDYVGEDSLADRLRAGAIATGQALVVAEQILQGLAYLHNIQIVHANLQPQTVIIDKDQPCRLIEFGLAKGFRTDGKQTMSPGMTSDLPSTLRYMSPEQIRESGKLTFSTDIWSFGVILYELLVGKPLFGASIMTLGNEILTKRLILDDNAIPVEMQPLLKRCVERDASYRAATAQIVLEEFREATDTLRRRQRHEHFLPIWLAVFEKRLLERFVAGYSGQFDGTTVQKFMEFAKEDGISQLDEEALASVLPPALDAQRAADTAAGELEREKAGLEKDLKNLSGAQMHERSDAIQQLEKKHADALKGVSVQIRRQLAIEVKEWDRVQAERAKRERRERQQEIERSRQLEAERRERERRELEEWNRVQAQDFERKNQEREKKLEHSRQLEAERIEREKQDQKLIRMWLELAAYAAPVALGLFLALLGARLRLAGNTGAGLAYTGIFLGVALFFCGFMWMFVSLGRVRTWRPYPLFLGGLLVIFANCSGFFKAVNRGTTDKGNDGTNGKNGYSKSDITKSQQKKSHPLRVDPIAVIEKELDHQDAGVRESAALKMLRLHPERLQITRLLELMAWPNNEVRMEAGSQLRTKLARVTAKDMELLRQGLKNPTRETQLAFIEAVGSLREEGKAAAPDLTAFVGSADKEISGRALIALEKMGKLVDIVHENTEAAVLTPTLVALRTKRTRTNEALASYEKHLDHPDIGVRDAAGLILLDLDPDRLKSDRLAEFVSGANEEISTAGFSILRKRLVAITGKDLPILRQGLKSPTRNVRIFFVNAIASLKADGKDAVADLADLLGSAEKELALPIIRAMEAMGKAGGEAIPSLEKQMKDSEKPVAVAAAHALCKIDPTALCKIDPKIDPTSKGVISWGVKLLLDDLNPDLNPDLSNLGALLKDPLDNRSASSLLEIGGPAVTPVVKYLLLSNHPDVSPNRKIEAAAGRLIGYKLVKEFAKKAKQTKDTKLTKALSNYSIKLDAYRFRMEPKSAIQPVSSPEVGQLNRAVADAAAEADDAVKDAVNKALKNP